MARATVSRKLKELETTPEALAADKLWQRIEEKLNFDGRYELLNPAETMLRMGRLTGEESEYFGRMMGYDQLYYGGIDWDSISTAMLAECVMQTEHGFRVLQCCHPAPDRALIFDNASSDDIEAFLAGELTFDELQAAAVQS